MKTLIKFTLILCIIASSFDAYSQIEKPITKGNMILGGGVSFNYTPSTSKNVYDSDNDTWDYEESSKSNSFSFNLSPSFGYFVTNGLVLGISPSFSYDYENTTNNIIYTSTQAESESKSNQSTFGVGLNPFIKYYFKNGIFVRLNTGFSMNWRTLSHEYDGNNAQDEEITYTSFHISPGIGYAIFITPKISLEPGLFLNYQRAGSKQSGETYTYKWDSNDLNIYLSAGFEYFF